MKTQFELTEQHFINAGYRNKSEFIPPSEVISKSLVYQFYKPVKDEKGKRFTIQVNGYKMPSNCPVDIIFEFKTQLSADEPIGHLNVSLSTGIDPNVSVIYELEIKLNAVWEKLGKNYED